MSRPTCMLATNAFWHWCETFQPTKCVFQFIIYCVRPLMFSCLFAWQRAVSSFLCLCCLLLGSRAVSSFLRLFSYVFLLIQLFCLPPCRLKLPPSRLPVLSFPRLRHAPGDFLRCFLDSRDPGIASSLRFSFRCVCSLVASCSFRCLCRHRASPKKSASDRVEPPQ